ncbi:MAG: hypothetical protein AAFX01_10835 [Cyanobacteria bacterium J06638_28]
MANTCTRWDNSILRHRLLFRRIGCDRPLSSLNSAPDRDSAYYKSIASKSMVADAIALSRNESLS